MNDVIKEFETSLEKIKNEDYYKNHFDLILASSKALAILKEYERLNIKNIMYDMARLAASAGYFPEELDRA